MLRWLKLCLNTEEGEFPVMKPEEARPYEPELTRLGDNEFHFE